jgi:hypothetical protein
MTGAEFLLNATVAHSVVLWCLCFRLRRRKSIVRKYGILASRGDVEMTPLGLEDEDEDTTMFEMPSHKSRP